VCACVLCTVPACRCNHVVVTGEQDLVKSVMDITGGKGAYAAVDCLCGDTVAQLCNAVRMRGLLVLYGAMTGRYLSVRACAFIVHCSITAHFICCNPEQVHACL
jgi:NADPH:quinone reductase-like Zn-dependent oxidoreductase